MRHPFTAAAERVLIYASGWTHQTGCNELEAVPLLVGLLSESECRAAMMLARHAIDLAAVRRRWPDLRPTAPPPQQSSGPPVEKIEFSPEVEDSLHELEQRLAMWIQPFEVATEHLLLGLTAADHKVAAWLRQQGLDPDALEAEILSLHGCHVKEAGDEGQEAMNEGQETMNEGRGTLNDKKNAPGRPSRGEVKEETATLRVLDAAANRGREGLRVVEDYVRFALDDQHLTEQLKQLRHDLTAALSQIPQAARLACRDTQADVGTTLTTSGEKSRADPAALLTANFARLQESLRTLEEFGKLHDPDWAAGFKQMRYRVYTLQRAVEITRSSLERLADSRLYVLLDGRPTVEAFELLAHSLIDAGADVIQLRDKQLADRTLLDRARRLRDLTQGTKTLMVVNDRPDLAVLARADGVHVGQEELTVKDARRIVGADRLVGVSTHSIQQARQAVLDGADYIGVGPTFPSGTKSFDRFPGLELLGQVAAEIRLPAFAIGGIDRRNVASVLATGIGRIAVGGAVISAADPAGAVRELRIKLEEDAEENREARGERGEGRGESEKCRKTNKRGNREMDK